MNPFRCVHILFRMLLFFTAFLEFAIAAPPSTVYRMDDRPPDGPNGIFTTGFHAWGRNYDPISHITGESCLANAGENGPDSAFIATTESHEWAYHNAYIYAERRNASMYVYTIRADPSFYSAISTANRYRAHNPEALSPFFEMMLDDQMEYMATDYIPSSFIRSASEYAPGPGLNIRLVRTIDNPGYVHRETQANSRPFTGYSMSVAERLRTWVSGIGPAVTACFAWARSGRSGSHDEFKRSVDGRPAPFFYPLEPVYTILMDGSS